MNFYRLFPSTDLKVVGKFPQCDDAIIPTTMYDPNYLDDYLFRFAPAGTYLPKLKLNNRAKVTDLITSVFGRMSSRLVVSMLLKEIIETSNYFGIQFLQTKVFPKQGQELDYWILNSYEHGFSELDLALSEFEIQKKSPPRNFIRTPVFTKAEDIVDCYLKSDGSKTEAGIDEFLVIKDIRLRESGNKEILTLRGVYGGLGWYVSELLKDEIEKAGCTGVEFKDVNYAGA
jgi:hypothetical protein